MFLYGNKLDATGSDDTPTAPAWEFYDLQKDPHEITTHIKMPSMLRLSKR